MDVTLVFLVRTEAIVSGMRLGKTITLASGRVLLTAGTILRPSFIEPLLHQGVAAVYVVNELAPDIVPQDVISGESRALLQTELGAVMSEVSDAFGSAAKRGVQQFQVGLNAAALSKAITKIVHEVMTNPTVVYNLQDIRTSDDYTLGHSVNVCVLTTLLGTVMGYSATELADLATGAAMHDIGKVSVPPEILNKPGRLTPEEMALMQRHTVVGWDILKDQRTVKPTAAIVALQHHERWMGGGYPNNLRGEKIYRYARICAIADCYDAMTADRVYRRGMQPVEALETMTKAMASFFQPDLLYSFTQCIAPYPVGALVELSDGYQAVVVAVKRGATTTPRVRVVLDPGGTALKEPYEVDLAAEPDLGIVRTIRIGEEPEEMQSAAAGE